LQSILYLALFNHETSSENGFLWLFQISDEGVPKYGAFIYKEEQKTENALDDSTIDST
jgi:hypothetical protein